MDLIIGTGISGLSYANFCRNKNYLILEKEIEPGGYCKTVFQNDFVWDYSGHFFHFQSSEVEKFLNDRMMNTEILKIVKNTKIKYKKRLINFPFQKNIHQLKKEDFIDCLFDLFTKTEKESYHSFKEMLYGKFGKSISEKFLIPYNEKLYSCDLDELEVDAMGRFFPYAKVEEIIKNMKEYDSKSYNDTFTYPKKGAIQYINGLLQDIPQKRILYNEEIIKIDIEAKVAYSKTNEYSYENVISTIPFPQLLKICGLNYDESTYSWNKVLVFNFGFDKNSIDQVNHWIYYPERKYRFYRVGFYNNILSTNKMSLYVEVGFNKNDIIQVDKERNHVLTDLQMAGIITNHNLIAEHYVILDPAYVHIKSNTLIEKTKTLKILKDHSVFSIGRYGDWKYCSIEDNIIDAKKLADEIK